MDVLIVGAGIAGLAAAHALGKAGLDALVAERADFVGGRMSSENVGGFVLDRGAYTLSSYATRTLGLAKETGCDGLVAPIPPWAGYVRRSRVRRYRSDSMPSMALGVGLWPTDMVSALLMLREANREAAHLRLHKPDERTFELEEETAADYALRIGGNALLERVAYPLLSALYLSDPEHISKAALLATVRYVKGLTLYNSPHGIGFLAEELARGSRVRLRTEVRSLRLSGDGIQAVLRTDGKDETVVARAAVCTAAAPDALAVLPEIDGPLASRLAEVAYTSSVPVALVLSRRIEEKAFSVSLPRDRFKHLALFTHEHNKCAGRVPEGRGLMMAYPNVNAGRAFMDLDDGDVVRAVLEDLHRVYPVLSDSVESTVVYRWRERLFATAPRRPSPPSRTARCSPQRGPLGLCRRLPVELQQHRRESRRRLGGSRPGGADVGLGSWLRPGPLPGTWWFRPSPPYPSFWHRWLPSALAPVHLLVFPVMSVVACDRQPASACRAFRPQLLLRYKGLTTSKLVVQ